MVATKVPVSERAIIQRIQRRMKPTLTLRYRWYRGLASLTALRSDRLFYIVNTKTRTLMSYEMTLDDVLAMYDVMEPWEEVVRQ